MFWQEDIERLCVECYEKKYGKRILKNILEITRKKKSVIVAAKRKILW